MRAAMVSAMGIEPALGEIDLPIPLEGENRVKVAAAAISHVTKARASGAHYSANDEFPFVVGVDGVGRLDDGSRVYFALPRSPFGSMAEFAVADSRLCIPLPDDLDDFTAAAIANPGMSSWAGLTERARLKRGETVLINGATGTSGRLAVQIAKWLGAGKVLATGRNPIALEEIRQSGADVIIQLGVEPETLDNRFMKEFAEGVDIVIDYLWGRSAERLLITAAKAGSGASPIRFVQVGSISGSEISLPGAVLRASKIELMGSGNGSVSTDKLVEITNTVLRSTRPARLDISFRKVPFAEFNAAWPKNDSTSRTVFDLSQGTK
ncbi:quinone oxidoreductase family protein [Shinella zoogloeoides]|uniref:quinone oxidoreductase family protein n=1 Tax=Shinella zoogloeoides TaxID=352475 RepID=UPI00273D5DA0|nr:zinc-binding alcohol dehydrogenase family protein [Shinella zoogloeoides]WLR91646.1 zinc-binding alcohol dehydrogenase family protein [Shinella zoogloeoides]